MIDSFKTFVLAILLSLSFVAAPAYTQDTQTGAAISQDALTSLRKVIEDQASRDALIDALKDVENKKQTSATTASGGDGGKQDAAADEEDGPPGLGSAFLAWLQDVGKRLPTAALGVPVDVKLDQAQTQIDQRLSAPQAVDDLKSFGVRSIPGWILVTVSGLLALFYVRRRTTRRIQRHTAMLDVVRHAILRSVLAILPALLCSIVATVWATLTDFSVNGGQIFLLLTFPFAIFIAVFELVACLLIFLIPSKGWRIVSYGQKKLSPLVALIFALAVAGSLVSAPEMRRMIGPATADLTSLLFYLSVPLLAIYVAIIHRRTVRSLIVRGHADENETRAWNRTLHWIGDHWHHLAFLFAGLNICALLFGTGGRNFLIQSLMSLGLIFVALVIISILKTFGRRNTNRALSFGRPTVATAIFARLWHTMKRLIQAVVVIGAAALCISIWGIDIGAFLQSKVGTALVAPIISIAVLSLIAWFLWIVLDTWIDLSLSADTGRARSARIRTLLPLLRNIAFVTLSILSIIGILSNLGINVAPLIASAGVVGLAVGFGSQQLVQDIITGLFILLEDGLAIGDVIDTGDRSGTVEALTIRTVKIRDGEGGLHSIPFSTIKALKNSSRGYGVYTANVTLDATADIEKASQILRQVGEQLQTDPDYGEKIIAPVEVLGIDQISLDGVVLKASVKTRPLQQYGVGRELNRRIMERLQKSGIPIASRAFTSNSSSPAN